MVLPNLITKWFREHFSNPEVVALVFTLLIIVGVFYLFGKILTPVFAAVVLAYLLDGLVQKLQRIKCPHIVAVSLVFILGVGIVCIAIVWLLPIFFQQLVNLAKELPAFIGQGNALIAKLEAHFPDAINPTHIQHFIASFKDQLAKFGQGIVSYSVSGLFSVIELIVYLILVPLMVFFFLKDRGEILGWFGRFIPQKSRLLSEVWAEVNRQTAAYVRAKVVEIIIVSVVSTAAFLIMGLNYAILLGVLVGLSVLIPFVGVTVVTFPVVVVAYLQWGWSAHFAYLVIVYGIIAILDGNVLAPLLFSEAVKLNPVAVIIAILIFGGLWGFWGVFFAIPLATVVKAIINAWPTASSPVEIDEAAK